MAYQLPNLKIFDDKTVNINFQEHWCECEQPCMKFELDTLIPLAEFNTSDVAFSCVFHSLQCRIFKQEIKNKTVS